MDIRTALAALVVIQESLVISDPHPANIVKAWPYVPPQTAALETPCCMNSWTMVEETRNMGAMRWQRYTIHMQLLCQNADLDVGYDEATAFHVALVTALDAAMSLGGTVKQQFLRGGDPTLAALDFGGKAYPGLNLFLDIQMEDVGTFAT